MKKLSTALAGLIALTCATPSLADVTLRMSSWGPPTSALWTDLIVPWTEAVGEATEGRVTIEILPTALGSPPQHYELARKGIADVTWGNLTYEPDRFKSVWFAEFPMSGSNGEASSAALWQTFETYLADLPAFDGTKMLGTGTLGGGAIHHSEKLISESTDFAGSKIRMGGPIQKRIIEELGAIPVAAPATKAYELVDGGVIDGSLHPIESVLTFSLEDALKYHTMVPDGLYEAFFFVVINDRAWNSIPPEDQALVMSVSGEVLSRQWGGFFDRSNEAALAKLTEMGHTIAEPSDEFTARIKGVRDTMISEWVADGASFGLPNAQEVVDFYEQAYQTEVEKLQ
jgi:TRAP-type C4-dicarboxylate transport system substrate-binding protein